MQNRYRLFAIIISILFVPIIATINAQEKERSPIASGAGYPNNDIMQNFHGNPSTPPVLSEAKGLRGAGLHFTPNKGQIADMNGKPSPDVLYKGEGSGTDVYLRKIGISYVYNNMNEVLNEVDKEVEELISSGIAMEANEEKMKAELIQKKSLKVHRVDMDFANCNANITTINEEELKGHTNYYYAHCPDGILNVKQYNKVLYKNIYNNIDVAYYGDKEHGIKYDLIVQPHADPRQIKLHWKGAESININRECHGSEGLTTSLVIKTSVNEFTESIPKVYQNINGKIIDIPAKYVLSLSPSGRAGEGLVTFELGTWNPEHSLIIDPWVTYYGGNNYDNGMNIVTDALGDVYVTGFTASIANIASTGFQNVFGGVEDALLVKFNSNGVRLWATYYGGTSQERAYGVEVDVSGNIFLAGFTSSTTGIASTGAFQAGFAGGSDAFLAKFNSTGTRLWATYYGGAGGDAAYSVCSDASGNVYLGGNTNSTSGFAFGGFQTIPGGGLDAFLVKFNTGGNPLWATYYGGTGNENGYSVITDASANVYLAGRTTSLSNIAATGFQNTYGGGLSDAFLVKFSSGGARIWGTYYGGTGRDEGNSIVSDFAGNIYLAGYTSSTTAIASGGFQNTMGGGVSDAFLVKFNGAVGPASRLWATYLGGTNSDYALSVKVDQLTTDVYISGDTYSLNFPTTSCAWQKALAGGISEDGFVTHFTSGGQIVCSSYVGGPAAQDDEDCHIALFGCYVYMTGFTSGGLYPVTAGAHQTVFGGINDIIVAQLYKNSCGFNKTSNINASANNISVCTNTPINFFGNFSSSCDNNLVSYSWSFPGGTPVTSNSQNPTGIIYASAGNYIAQLKAKTTCDSSSKDVSITINQCFVCNLVGQFTKGTANCTDCGCKEWIMVNASGGTSPYSYSWPDGNVNRYKNQLCPGSYSVNIKDKNGCSVNLNLTAP